MSRLRPITLQNFGKDALSSVVVFLVALPLCLGIALACGDGTPILSGLIAGMVGGIVVGVISGSQTSVSGVSNSVIAIVGAQVLLLGSFEAFLFAVVIAGAIQVAMAFARLGFLSSFFPSSVVNGLLAAIGVILVLKQIPHLVGHHIDPEGDMSFFQMDKETTFSELVRMLGKIHPGSATIGIGSFLLIYFWDSVKPIKKFPIPSALLVIIFGVSLSLVFQQLGTNWALEDAQRVQVPVPKDFNALWSLFRTPDFSVWNNPAVYSAGLTIAIVVSLETLLNLEAVDRIDPQQRVSPPNRELFAQGVGNILTGLLGGLPISSVIVRSSVNINAGAQTQVSTILHGVLLVVCVFLFPSYLNAIPISCLAAILFSSGIKLASPVLFKRMWSDGYAQFVPFLITLTAITFTDLLTGTLIGLAVSIAFILRSNLRRPLRRMVEKRHNTEVVRIELANQVSFLNRATIASELQRLPRNGQLILDARQSDYIDPDILTLIREYRDSTAPARDIELSLIGFSGKFPITDQIRFREYTTKDMQSLLSPAEVIKLLKEGNERFRTGNTLARDFRRQLSEAAQGQSPLAVILSCIDSRSPAELIFDLGLGDIFSVRVAGNIVSPKVLGSMEYACAVAGAKLVLVLGHTHCGAVTAATSLACSNQDVVQATGCANLEPIMTEIQRRVDKDTCKKFVQLHGAERAKLVDDVAARNVVATVAQIRLQSETLARLTEDGSIAIVGAMYDVGSGKLQFLDETVRNPTDSFVHAVKREPLTA